MRATLRESDQLRAEEAAREQEVKEIGHIRFLELQQQITSLSPDLLSAIDPPDHSSDYCSPQVRT